MNDPTGFSFVLRVSLVSQAFVEGGQRTGGMFRRLSERRRVIRVSRAKALADERVRICLECGFVPGVHSP